MPDVIHRYLLKCKTNPNPPGLADFLRGTIALYQYAKQYNYILKFDMASHPIFKMLDIPELNRAYLDHSQDTIELIPPIPYSVMPHLLDTLFTSMKSFPILTNAFYRETSNMTDEYNFIKSILKPSSILNTYIEQSKINTGLDYSKPYAIIHVRDGDHNFEINHEMDNKLVEKVRNYIQIIQSQSTIQTLFISDSHKLKQKVSDICKITQSIPIHIGTLTSLDSENINTQLLTTLGEFFIMSGASNIYCLNHWDGSGYSRICAKIFSIDYYPFKL